MQTNYFSTITMDVIVIECPQLRHSKFMSYWRKLKVITCCGIAGREEEYVAAFGVRIQRVAI
jgi:hypothetical protein